MDLFRRSVSTAILVQVPLWAAAGCSGSGTDGTGGAGAQSGTDGDTGGAAAGNTGGSAQGSGAASGSGAAGGSDAGVGGSGGSPATPPDCSGITAAGFELCESGADFCGAVFTDSSGCTEVCAAAGLACETAYENTEDACGADTTLPALACDSGHQSDYCRCSGPLGGTGGTGGTGGAGGTGGGGTGGTGGLPTVPDNGCNVQLTDEPVGFASMDGGTVGGGDVTPILVTTKESLASYLADSTPRVLYVMNDLDFRTENRGGVAVCVDNTTCNNGSGVQIDNPRVSSTCDAGEHAGTSYRYEQRLTVKSNKTVIGIGDGDGAAIRGAGLSLSGSSQIILRNLRIWDINPHIVEAGDGITLENSTHIWLDHLRLEQISDGYVDIGSASLTSLDDYITLSYIHFNGRTAYQCGGKHSYVNFIDNARVTYHHNWFDNGNGRNPKIGGEPSKVHLYNNYWLNIGYFCITAQMDSEARVESNYFENSSRPHWRQTDGNGTAGIAIDGGNVYAGSTSATYRDTGGTVFSVPYSYTKQSAADAKTATVNCSGPQPIR